MKLRGSYVVLVQQDPEGLFADVSGHDGAGESFTPVVIIAEDGSMTGLLLDVAACILKKEAR